MSEQASLPGMDAPLPGGDVLFFAVVPDAQTAEQAHELAWRLRARHGLHGKPLPAERLHISLQGLGAYSGVPTQVLEIAEQAASRCHQAGFDICFDRAMSFARADDQASPRAYVVRGGRRSEELQTLHVMLSRGLRALGLVATASRSFTPHMTLLYDRRRVDEEQIEPIRWRADAVVLVRSAFGSGRPYQILRRWPLSTSGPDR